MLFFGTLGTWLFYTILGGYAMSSDLSWIEEKVDEMVALMNQHQIPQPHESCKNCAYSEQYAKVIHPSGIDHVDHSQGSLF